MQHNKAQQHLKYELIEKILLQEKADKEDYLEVLKKKKNDEQARSRFFVKKYQESMDYIDEGLAILPKSHKQLLVVA